MLITIFYALVPILVGLLRTGEWVVFFVLALQVRNKIQARDGITPDQLQDMLCTCCCFSCVLCQMGRHEYPKKAGFDSYKFTEATGLAQTV